MFEGIYIGMVNNNYMPWYLLQIYKPIFLLSKKYTCMTSFIQTFNLIFMLFNCMHIGIKLL